jgi:arsenite oxidase small subunit
MTDVARSVKLCMGRRKFLLASGAAAATLITLPGCLDPFRARVVRLERKRIGSLSALETDVPVLFSYPDDDPLLSTNTLIKLGVPAGGGVGPEQDVVAFNTLCPHMGGPLAGTYKSEHKGLGPCPLHLTSFDLTRHGIVVSGHASESLPQILLETEGDEIYATGIMGLLFGRATNAT